MTQLTIDGRTLSSTFCETFGKPLDFARWKTTYAWNNQVKDPTPGAKKTSTLDAHIDAAASGYMRRTLADDDFPERQIYSDAGLGIDPFTVTSTGLTITARPITPEERARHVQGYWGREFASGLLTTERSFAQRYGYFELEARFPTTPGTWGGFWLLEPHDPKAFNHNEIDAVETIGGEPTMAHFTGHWWPAKPTKAVKGVAIKPVKMGVYHRWGVLWTPESIVSVLDGVVQERTRMPNVGWHAPMYMLIDLAVGGRWPESVTGPPKAADYPAALNVRRVRAFALV